MPAPRPPYMPDNYYHFLNRGRSRLSIFREPENYYFVLQRTKKYARTFNLQLIAYCLMPNHYHFLIRQDGEDPAGLLPQRVFNSYSKAFNKRYGHSGTLFEGNYRVVWVEDSSHLLHLCRYIHANPVKHGMVDDPADWPYSNYQEWIGQRPGTLFDPLFLRTNFHTPDEYRQFVMDYLSGKARMPAELAKRLVE